MGDYDFRVLNDKEFEILCCDLTSEINGVRFERFKPGRDAGVDGRFFSAAGKEEILQCKHWVDTPLEKLITYLKNKESEKVKRLNPDRYILAVSHALSRNDKRVIQEIFHPYIRSPNDILGREDLNDLLSRYKWVEERHFKLWITSSTVLEHFLNKPIHERSEFALKEILDSAPIYVATRNHFEALEKLERLGCTIITGPAGIGKTTLANHLILHYVSDEFEMVYIADGIREAESVYSREGKQIFYFDDFLGRNYLEALSGHEGSHIVNFIKRVKRDRNKRFILTSRSTILNQGKILNDVFQHNKLNQNEFEIRIESLSALDKAQILYNHIWHSNFGVDFIEEIYYDKRYRKIIDHRNFNPRLIRFITDADFLYDCHPSNYWQYVSNLLNNPAKVWENPFEAQLDDFGRALVLLVALNSRPVEEGKLAEFYQRYISSPENFNLVGRRDFLFNLKHLTGSFFDRQVSRAGNCYIKLFNPSIGDYIYNRFSKDLPTLKNGFSSLRSTESLDALKGLSDNGFISEHDMTHVAESIVSFASTEKFVGYEPEYIATASLLFIKDYFNIESIKNKIRPALEFVLTAECPILFEKCAVFIGWGMENSLASEESAYVFFQKACEHGVTSNELDELKILYENFDMDFKGTLTPIYEDLVKNYLIENVVEEFPESDVFNMVDPEDYSQAENNLEELIDEKAFQLGVDVERFVDEIIEAYDIYSKIDDYFRYQSLEDEEFRLDRNLYQFDEIDDLFDRDR